MNKKIYQLVSVFAVFILVFGNSNSAGAASTYGAPRLQSQVVAIPAFPGAEGFGANTVGGRGGTVYEVTNTNDSGAGSLRSCVEATGSRICIFKVGGLISLNSPLTIRNPFITIAGQTAPGGGITIKLGTATEAFSTQTHDVIIRYITVRPGPGGENHTNQIAKNGSDLYNIIIDHNSMSWGVDSNIETWYRVRDATIQWSLISEALDNSTHSKGAHSKGIMIGGYKGSESGGKGSENISILNDLMAHNADRNPLMQLCGIAQVINNVTYNPMYSFSHQQLNCPLGESYVNWINNYHKKGPSSTSSDDLKIIPADSGTWSPGKVYLKGNIGPSRSNDTLPETAWVEVKSGAPAGVIVTSPAPAPTVYSTNAIEAYNNVLADGGVGNSRAIGCDGNWYNRRDSIDARIINEVKAGTGKIIDNPSQVGGWIVPDVGTPCTDSDHDGMPDTWEQLSGLNPNTPDGSGDKDGDGYTNVEEYFNGTTSQNTTPPTTISVKTAVTTHISGPAASVDFIVTFSKDVTGVDVADFSLTTNGVSGAAVSGVSGSGSVYTVSVSTGIGDGTLRLDVSAGATVTDLAGNPLAGLPYASGESYTIDKTAPALISSVRVNANPTVAASVDFTVSFSEPVTGVDAGDFALSKTGMIAGESIASVNGGPNIYTVSVNTGTESGDLRLDVPASTTITDLAGNLLVGLPYTSGESYTIDKTAPALISSVRVNANPTIAASVDFTVSFSEPVAGVDVGDFTLFKTGMIAGESIMSVNGGPNIYTVSVNTGTESGDLRLDLPASATVTDLAGNLLAGLPYASGESYTIDKTMPVVISSARVNVDPTSAVSVDFTVSFSEPVTGVDVGDFALSKTGAITGELVTGVNGGASVYTVSVNTGVGDGTLRLDLVDNDSIVDVTPTPLGGAGLGNGNFTVGETYTIDKNAPLVVSSLRSDSNPSTAESIHFTVTFTEAVSGVDASDFMLTTTDGLSGASVTGLSGSANTYSIAVATGSNNGTLRLDLIDNDSIVDSVNQPLGGLGAGNGNFIVGDIYTINKTPINTVKIVSETFRSNGTNDGWVLESSEDSNTGGSKNSKADTFNLGDDAKDRQYRAILHFPTNHLPDKAVVTQVILTFKSKGVVGTDPFTTHQNISVDIRKGVFNNSSFFNFGSLQIRSFQAPADVVSAATIQNNPVDGWYWAMLDSKALAYINLTGATQIRLGFQLDDNDDMGDDYIKFYSGNYGAQKYRPQLQIQYYVQK